MHNNYIIVVINTLHTLVRWTYTKYQIMKQPWYHMKATAGIVLFYLDCIIVIKHNVKLGHDCYFGAPEISAGSIMTANSETEWMRCIGRGSMHSYKIKDKT